MTGVFPERRSAALDYLVLGAREQPFADELFAQFCAILSERDGAPLDRGRFHLRVLHPQFLGATFGWTSEKGALEVGLFGPEMLANDAFVSSPIRAFSDGETTLVEQRLDRPPEGRQFPIYDDLRKEGFVHYLGLAVPFVSGAIHSFTAATRAPEGFSPETIAFLQSLTAPLASAVELRVNRRLAKNVLEAYVGKRTSELILAGDIRRGAGIGVEAAIWTCDLRGFTQFSDSWPREAVIAALNDYFDVMAGAVEEQGGEVLKFVGDAVLAIFPIEDPSACARALEAARVALRGMRALNASRIEVEEPPLDFGIALHVGEVTYGNIGSATRLDFTVIGPAVNEAARIEKLCRKLRQRCLLSDRFASTLVADCLIPLGEHTLDGVGRAIEVFGIEGGQVRSA